jgi:hypothetical protein
MTTELSPPSTKRGRKPHGAVAMSGAERKRRSRERLMATGAKDFQVQVQGIHLAYVEQVAGENEQSNGAVLREIFERALDRFVGVVRRGDRMKENGATDEEVAAFWQTYYMPELPIMPEKKGQ